METNNNCQPICCCPSNEEIFVLFKNAAELHNENLLFTATLQNYLDLSFSKAFPNNPWHKAAQGSNLPNWLSKGLRDLGGFIVGAGIGTLIGGPVVGAAGGTLVGGACSSSK